ncbi:MAG TPA: hypothetical protein VLB84_17535 [Bacteroidia bacterium]|nr:hypothetical protein [Bacteroidia bacterium]
MSAKKVSKSITIDADISDQLLLTSLREFLISQSEFINFLLVFYFSNKTFKKAFDKFLRKELKK